MTEGNAHDAEATELARVIEAINIPSSLDTPLGNFDFVDGMPTKDSTVRLFEGLDFMRGVEAFLNAMPGASLVALRHGLRSIGVTKPHQIAYTDPRMTSGSIFLTPNTATTYGTFFIDLHDGPMVIEPPKSSLCVVDDFWFRYVTDMGLAGPDKGQGGKYLFLPPEYTGEIPAGYFVCHTPTYSNWVVIRALGGVPALKETKVYALSNADDAPEMEFLNFADVKFNTVHANDFSFFEEVNELVQEEPASALDPERAGQLAALGIVHGSPFNPSPDLRATLEKAAGTGAGISRALFASPRDPDAFYYEGSNWATGFIGGSHEFLRNGARLLDARTTFHYLATVITPAMTLAQVGAGSVYAYSVEDSEGNHLDGGKSYTITLPPNPPANQFWSIDVYDTQTRSLLQTDDPYPSVVSNVDSVESNDDGSFTIWFGPTAPESKESNWIQTVPGKSWFPVLRLYGPLESWFDKTWRPSEVHPV